MKKFKIVAALLAVSMLFTSVPMQVQAAKGPKGMEKVAENEYLTLYIDEEETDIAVVDNKTGKIWYSNPTDSESDSVASVYYQRVLKSQLQITYYNSAVQSSTMDNYNDSIANKQFVINEESDGVTVIYTLGDLGTQNLLLPLAISETNMQKWMDAMPESALKKINRNYTLIDPVNGKKVDIETHLEAYPGYVERGENFYVLRSSVKDYLREELSGYFIEAGYTMEDHEAEMIAGGAGEAENDKPWFTIPLTYRLEEDSLVVCVDPESVDYNDESYYLVDIDILPYFGAAGADEEGYIFVPDGSGALINLNNGKTTVSSYSAVVFGTDETSLMLSNTRSEIDHSRNIKMPVFGIKSGDQALFSVIEEGAGYANITADIGGRITSYNKVNAGFAYLQYGLASLSDMVGANVYQMYGPAEFEGIYQLRYFFLTDEDADYSGMANVYRQYLEETGVLTKNDADEKIPFYVEFIGSINKYKTFLGVKYNAVEAVTTYKQAEEIVSTLNELGIDDPTVIYSGWMNGGLRGTAATKVRPVAALNKGGTNLNEFQQNMKNNDIDVYMTVDMQYVYQDKPFDGYSTLMYGPGYFDRNDIIVKEYVLADGSLDGKLANLISPYYAGTVSKALVDAASKYMINGFNLGSASNYLYSDFLEDRFVDRQKAIGLYQDAITSMDAAVEGLLGDNNNVYTMQYTEDIINAPFGSNSYQLLDEDVPFYEMVLHGYMNYAGEPMNMADDYTTALLKSVESGAGLYYQWIYADNSVLTETDFDYLYSVGYKHWIDTAAKDYQKVNQALNGLENLVITEHEILAENVTRTTYEDGTEVYVNFGKNDVSCDGVTISGKDFVVKKGSE